MEKMEADVTLGSKDMSRFLIRHNYSRFGGVFGVIISLASIVLLIIFWGKFIPMQRGILIILGLMFTVIQPFMLWVKGLRQLKNEVFQKPFHYIFTRENITVSQDEYSEKIEWGQIRKVISSKDALYVYTSPVNAFIIPAAGCEGSYVELVKFMNECRGAKK